MQTFPTLNSINALQLPLILTTQWRELTWSQRLLYSAPFYAGNGDQFRQRSTRLTRNADEVSVLRFPKRWRQRPGWEMTITPTAGKGVT